MVTGLSGSLQQIFQNGILPVLMLKLITEYGVMVTFNYISQFVLIVGAPILWIGMRDKPENYMLLPDAEQVNEIISNIKAETDLNIQLEEFTEIECNQESFKSNTVKDKNATLNKQQVIEVS